MTSIGTAMILMTFPLPNIKPFNCAPCLSTWIAIVLLFTFDVEHIWCAPIAYSLMSLILTYERKR